MNIRDYVVPLVAQAGEKTIEEVFVSVEGTASGAWVSNFGRCFSTRFKRLTSVTPTATGYVSPPFKWAHAGAPHYGTRSLHRVVAYYFCDPPANYQDMVPDHVDGVRHNNFFQNLEWVTSSDNQKRAIFRGARDSRGKDHSLWFRTDGVKFPTVEEAIAADAARYAEAYSNAKKRSRGLPVDLILKIRAEYDSGVTPAEIFKRHHVFPETICRLIGGKTYQWVTQSSTEADRPKPGPKDLPTRADAGEIFARTIITSETIAEVLGLKDGGMKCRRIADQTGLHPGTVKTIMGGRHKLQREGKAQAVPKPVDAYASRRGSASALSKITKALIYDIYKDHLWDGMRQHHICKKYVLGAPTIHKIVNGSHWTHRDGEVLAPDVWLASNPNPSPPDTVPEASLSFSVPTVKERTTCTPASNPKPSTNKEWRRIIASDKYLVSNEGEIWSCRAKREINTKVAKTGYVNINLGDGVGTCFVHHIVASAWIGPKPSRDHVIDHIDGDKTNNRVSNLEWVTRKENTRRAVLSGRMSKGNKGSGRLLTSEQVYAIRRETDKSFPAMAKEMGVDPTTVRNAAYGVFYSDYLEVPPLPLNRAPGTFRPGAGGARNVGPRNHSEQHPADVITALPDEDWKRLIGNVDGYWVSNMGRVWSAKTSRLKVAVVNTKQQNYLRIQLRTNDSQYTSFMLHRLVAEYFLPPPPSAKHVVGHMNENPQDARASNLCWITRSENAVRAHRFKTNGCDVSSLHDFISSHIDTDRDYLVEGISVDVFIPSLNIGFKYEDVCLTSERSGVGPRVRRDAKNLLASKGIKLYYVFSHEWEDKRKVLESVILSKLGLSPNRVFGRKTEVRQVSSSDAMAFLRSNHLQGAVGSRHRYGAYIGEDLVALMTFGARRYTKSTTGSYELLRYVTKLDHSVVGGFSKLLKHFTRSHEVTNLISFADRRWSDGAVYAKNGFEHIRTAAPNYFYFKPEQPHNLKSRVMFQKHKLSELLDEFDPDKTEFENMVANGWDRIWDCGNLVYELST